MDVYRQAANIVDRVRNGDGTAKALCLEKQVQKKKQTYAVVCETLRHFDVLEATLNDCQFYDYYPTLKKQHTLVLTMAYDVAVGRGALSTRQHDAARTVTEAASFLRRSYHRVKHRFHILPRQPKEVAEDEAAFDEDSTQRSTKRQNTLLRNGSGGGEHVPSKFIRANTLNGKSEAWIMTHLLKNTEAMGVARDRHFPDWLLAYPGNAELRKLSLVKQGHAVIQDKGSCLPAAVLCGRVPVVVEAKTVESRQADWCPTWIVDGCSAPGNKTLHMAMLQLDTARAKMGLDSGGGGGDSSAAGAALSGEEQEAGAKGERKSAADAPIAALKAMYPLVTAIERDPTRFALLESRVAQHCRRPDVEGLVKCFQGDFLELPEEMRKGFDSILLDPSCSSSGVVSRIDVALRHHNQAIAGTGGGGGGAEERPSLKRARTTTMEEEEGDAEEELQDSGDAGALDQVEDSPEMIRVRKLAGLQKRLLLFALSQFPNCRRVVYSTCSVNREENEAVVAHVLRNVDASQGWMLSDIMPKTWTSRGWPTPAEEVVNKNANKTAAEGDDDTAADDDQQHELKAAGAEGAQPRAEMIILPSIPTERCIRCEPGVDGGNGFFIACFDR